MMKKMITISLSVFTLLFLSSFQTAEGQESDLNQTLQKSKEVKRSQNNKQASRFNSNKVVLNKANLSNWNQTRVKFIRLTSQIKVSPQKNKVISDVKLKLNEINGLMKRVDILQKNPIVDKPALLKVLHELQKYEIQIILLQQKLVSPMQPWNTKQESTGDDSQLANIDLQNILQKQQQTIQMMSNVAKVLHDTSMAVIRKMGG